MTPSTQTNPFGQVSFVGMSYTSPFVFPRGFSTAIRAESNPTKLFFYPSMKSVITNFISFPCITFFSRISFRYFLSSFKTHRGFVFRGLTHFPSHFFRKNTFSDSKSMLSFETLGLFFLPFFGVFRFMDSALMNTTTYQRTEKRLRKLFVSENSAVFPLVSKSLRTNFALLRFKHSHIINLITLCNN